MKFLFHRRRSVAEPEVAVATDDLLARPAGPHDLAMQMAHRHLVVSYDGTWAYYVVGEVDWQFRTPDDRARILSAQTSRLADLIGRRIILRGTSAPFNRRAWVARLDRDFPAPESEVTGRCVSRRLADVDGASTFSDVLTSAQEHMIDLGARSSAVILAVRITPEKLREDELRKLLHPTQLGDKDGTLEDLRRQVRQVTAIVARDGLNAKPIAPNALGWLIHASLGMGCPVPPVLLAGKRDGWLPDEIPGFGAEVVAASGPYAGTTTVRALRDGQQITRHVAVLHAQKFEDRDLDNPGLAPWLAWFQGLEYGVDVVACFDLLRGGDIRGEAERARRLAKNIAEHHEEHNDEPPAAVVRGIIRAREVEDEVTNGDRAVSGRARGVVMVAVTGESEEDAIELANDLASRASEEQGITLVQGHGQYASYRAFVPGEPIAQTGYITQMPLYYLASAVPNASTRGGDGTGWLVGNIGGGHDVMLFDPHGGSMRGKSNLMAVGGDPGAGKSTLGAALLDWEARLGIRSIGYDPAGQWPALCDLPHLRNDARHFDLFSARRGFFAPSLMVVEPDRFDYETDEEWRDACKDAAQERMDLTIDTLRDLLPFAMTNGDQTGRVVGAIESAVEAVGGGYGENPWKVLDRLTKYGEVGREVAERLTTRAGLKDGALMFPERTDELDDEPLRAEMEKATLTILTLKGLALPPKDNPHRATWTRQQQAAIPILNLGSRFATRLMYADKNPKTIQMDEIGISTGGAGGSFGPFLTRASVDSRKWNANVGLYFQNPRMLLDLDPEMANLVGCAWVGRMAEGAAKSALDILRLDRGLGFERLIAGLDQGEFVVRDWVGRVRRVRVDRDWWDPATLEAIDTTPLGEGTYDAAELADLFGVRA